MTNKRVIFPLQPIHTDEHGVKRFVENTIIRYLLENASVDLNDIAMKDFTQAEHEQLAQLIGYSVSGFGGLSYVRDETYEAAEKISEGEPDELITRNKVLREQLDTVRKGLRDIVPAVFRIHPDDLED